MTRSVAHITKVLSACTQRWPLCGSTVASLIRTQQEQHEQVQTEDCLMCTMTHCCNAVWAESGSTYMSYSRCSALILASPIKTFDLQTNCQCCRSDGPSGTSQHFQSISCWHPLSKNPLNHHATIDKTEAHQEFVCVRFEENKNSECLVYQTCSRCQRKDRIWSLGAVKTHPHIQQQCNLSRLRSAAEWQRNTQLVKQRRQFFAALIISIQNVKESWYYL